MILASRLSFIAIGDVAEAGPVGRVASLATHRARQTLEQAQALASGRALRADTELVEATNVVDALIARAGRGDLLVVGSHGDASAATGSVATALARRAPGPLLVARAGASDDRRRPRILVALDDSAAAAALVTLAGSIAAGCHGYVHLIHVQGRGYGSHTRHRLAELGTALIEQTGSEPVVEVARAANVAAQVCHLAQDSDAGLVVVGRRRAGSPAPGAVSPVGERIVHGAPCSVLVLPLPAG